MVYALANTNNYHTTRQSRIMMFHADLGFQDLFVRLFLVVNDSPVLVIVIRVHLAPAFDMFLQNAHHKRQAMQQRTKIR